MRSLVLIGAALSLLTGGAVGVSWGDTSRPAPYAEGASARVAPTPDNYRASLTGLLHWAHFPVRVAFVNSMTVGDQDLDRLARNGFEQWVTATRGGVKFEVVREPERADITVTYDVIAARPGNGERLGQTGFRFNKERGVLSRASIHLNVWDRMTRGDLTRFQYTAAHEFGHALGINGHSPDPGDLMYFSSSSAEGVTARDLNTLRQAYGGFSRAFASKDEGATKRL